MFFRQKKQSRMLSKNAMGKIISAVILLVFAATANAASKPTTVAEIALYQGPDRERMLIDGAKREGQVMFYNSNTWLDTVAREFEKRYPFIKVSIWRSDSTNLVKRTTEEYASGRFLVDVVETTPEFMAVLHKKGALQEYYSPEITAYSDDVKANGKIGVYYLADREMHISLGFNTKVVSPVDAPKNYNDLLDSKWKGKMTLSGDSVGARWVGHLLNVMGREYLERLGRQDIKVQNIAPAALISQVISGEIPLSPASFYSNIFTAKKTGAPVEWRPLEPVIATLGSSGVTARAPHPHAALLFLDYLHSKEGQQVVMQGGLSSPREDLGSVEQKFKKTYFGAQYSLEEFDKKFNEWEALMKQLFIRKR